MFREDAPVFTEETPFHERLRQVRLWRHMTEAQVAALLHMTQQAYGHYELGQRQPTPGTIKKLAEIFDVPITVLL